MFEEAIGPKYDEKIMHNKEDGIVYPKFEPFFSKEDSTLNEGKITGCFGMDGLPPEQVSSGKAPWDEFGWSRDGWVI